MCGKTGYNRKRATCFATYNTAKRDGKQCCALYRSRKKPCHQYCWKTSSNVVGNTRNIVIHLVLQQCCKTSCRFFVPSLLSFRAKQGIFQKKVPQVSILLRPSYRFPRVTEIFFSFPSKVKFGEVNILIVRWTDCALSVVKIEKTVNLVCKISTSVS